VGTNDTSEMAGATGQPPRRWGRALLWLGLLLALVAVAVVVSFAAEDDDDPLAQPPIDEPTFCSTAERFDSVPELDFSSTGLDELRELRTVALQLAALSPEPIAEDLAAVGDALQRVVDTIQDIPPDDPAGVSLIAQSLDRELGSVSEEANEAAAYRERWCGPRTIATTAGRSSGPAVTGPSG